MRTRTYGKWHILMAHHATLPGDVHVTPDNVDNVAAAYFLDMADLIDDYEIHDDGTATLSFAWVGDVHAHEDEIEQAGRQLLDDDGYPGNLFRLNEDMVTWEGYDPADYYDC